MRAKASCYFCGLDSDNLPYRRRAEDGISCRRCGDYYIDDLLVETKDPSVKEFSRILSGYTRWEKELGNPPPEISADNIDGIIARHKGMSTVDKIDRILLFYSKRNPQKGSYIDYNLEMDYPISFSDGTDEFWYLILEEADKTCDYLDIAARGILRITPAGWRRIDRLIKISLANEKFKIEVDKVSEKISSIDAAMKETANTDKRYSSVLARQLGNLMLQSSLEKLDKKLETDKELIFKATVISEPDDVNLLIGRIKEYAELEREILKGNISQKYKECRANSYIEVDLENYIKKFDRKVKEIEIDLAGIKSIKLDGVDMSEHEKEPILEGAFSKANPKKVFVVHGRNEKARRALFEFLRSIDIQPIEWGEAIKATGKASPYIGEILEKAFNIAQAIIVLFTGDDIARLRDEYIKEDDPEYEKSLMPQARTNVAFEAGLAFGTHPDRTILVQLAKERTKPFSDIYGRHFVMLSNELPARLELISKLKTANCDVNIEHKEDWVKSGDFDGSII